MAADYYYHNYGYPDYGLQLLRNEYCQSSSCGDVVPICPFGAAYLDCCRTAAENEEKIIRSVRGVDIEVLQSHL